MKWLPDTWLTLFYLLSSALSLVVLTSISPDRVGQQAFWFGLGFIIFLYLSYQDSAIYKTLAPICYFLAIFLLLATLGLGETVRGSTRWIRLGTFQLQAGEFVKPLLILTFAYFLHRYPPKIIKNLVINIFFFAIPAIS